MSIGILCFVDLRHFDIVGSDGAVVDSGHYERYIHTGVVVLSIVVYQRTDETFRLQHWELLERLALAHEVGRLHVFFTG